MSEKIFKNLQTFLTQSSTKFRVLEHENAGTSELVAKARGTHLGQGAKALVCCVKGVNEIDTPCVVPQNLRLDATQPSGRNGRVYVLAVLPADHKADLDALATELGGKKASLASTQEIASLTDCVIGSIPPFSFHEKLMLVVDENLFKRFDEIAFNAGLLDRSIVLDVKDYARICGAKVIKFANL
ncbi:YbaK/EbsC family protein [Campylobacter suis]|uniref:YbaK/aminoacyl-tRNA synthetase-associated domain-containing protein n=1 Tax=Campylobacter suis TaxID=2790657 RepID=A0ABN7K6E3_9BACT|nr:YbaK/EbsC family protein [Campylobacter suis]CAD7288064.1 hypothetical protein LMG8286_01120 [Campylobacter suis]